MIRTIFEILAVLAAAWGVFELAYNRWERLFLLTRRVWFWLTNPTARWSVQIDCEGDFRTEAREAAVTKLREVWPDVRKRADRPLGATLQTQGILVDLDLDQELPSSGDRKRFGHFVLSFHDVRASYRESRTLVDAIADVVHRLTQVLSPNSVKYSATIKFQEENPYFGLYTKRIPLERVTSFTCVLHPSLNSSHSTASATVVVSKDAVSLAADSPVRWASLSKRYLGVR